MCFHFGSILFNLVRKKNERRASNIIAVYHARHVPVFMSGFKFCYHPLYLSRIISFTYIYRSRISNTIYFSDVEKTHMYLSDFVYLKVTTLPRSVPLFRKFRSIAIAASQPISERGLCFRVAQYHNIVYRAELSHTWISFMFCRSEGVSSIV